ncbi:Thioredoxin-1, partial [Talaromyces pinophilus]
PLLFFRSTYHLYQDLQLTRTLPAISLASFFTTSARTARLASLASARRTFTSSSLTRFHSSPVTMGVKQLANKSEFDAALKSDKLVVVDAFAEWCGPCKAIAPKVHAWSEEHTDVDFVKFDVDESPDVAQELGIRAMPTFLFFKNGQKITEVVGVNPPALEAAIKNNK